jgi:hypothetical protein
MSSTWWMSLTAQPPPDMDVLLATLESILAAPAVHVIEEDA